MNKSVDKTGGPAFPGVTYKQIGDVAYVQPTKFAFPGMSLRAWFAGQAMKAIIESTTANKAKQEVIDGAIEYADLMIAALNN